MSRVPASFEPVWLGDATGRDVGFVAEDSPRESLTLVPTPGTGPVVSAPPVLIASSHTIDYTCGQCGIVLLHAERGQVHNLLLEIDAVGEMEIPVSVTAELDEPLTEHLNVELVAGLQPVVFLINMI
jgi:hypothetical protein